MAPSTRARLQPNIASELLPSVETAGDPELPLPDSKNRRDGRKSGNTHREMDKTERTQRRTPMDARTRTIRS